eukprot:c6685_g1_i1.p1 GENE.c6685_g1_i1~~c6685_g1_i1.p1  ORF type:complete len:303 (+),score=58.37 c6685_g1_i1:113-910(+)
MEPPSPRAKKAELVEYLRDSVSSGGHGTSASTNSASVDSHASGSAPTLPTWLWIPNLIGYTRVLLLALSMYYSADYPYCSMICYMASMGMDAVDGVAARHFGQTSQFGAVLDMVTDRVTTLSLTCVLGGRLMPEQLLAFTFLGVLDIASHWVLMYKSLFLGASSHKSVDSQKNLLMRIYYTWPYAMLIVCFFSEAFYVSLFMLKSAPNDWHFVPWADGHISFFLLWVWLATPFFVFKQIVNVIQMFEAFADLGKRDFELRAAKFA